MENNIIYENNNYTVEVGEGAEDGLPTYHLINKEHGVIEAETSVLPQAISMATQFNDALEQVLDQQEDNQIVSASIN
jgi:hypothetical protein